MLRRGGSTWADPAGYLERAQSPEFIAACASWSRSHLKGTFASDFFGVWRQLSLASLRRLSWGWKDPRTCITLDIWRELFPRARLLHIVRHPLDVSLSLQRRENLREKSGIHPPYPQIKNMGYCLGLWETYVEAVEKHRSGEARYYEVRFEDLIQDSHRGLKAILEFCDVEAPPDRSEAAARLMNESRTCRFDEEVYDTWR